MFKILMIPLLGGSDDDDSDCTFIGGLRTGAIVYFDCLVSMDNYKFGTKKTINFHRELLDMKYAAEQKYLYTVGREWNMKVIAPFEHFEPKFTITFHFNII